MSPLRLLCSRLLAGAGCALAAGFLFSSADAGQRPAEAASPVQRLESLLEPIRGRRKLPALAGAVIRGKTVVGIGAVGVRKLGNPTPVTVDDRFHLGSNTKAMTATLIARLVERHRLSWGTTLAQGLPDLDSGMRPEWRSVTLLHLMQHRGGFPTEGPPGATLAETRSYSGDVRQQRTRYLRAFFQQKPLAKPGSRFNYSNGGYVAAGAIAERAMNASWEELLRREVFQPLHMDGAGFGNAASPGKVDQPWPHLFQNGKSEPIPPGPLSDNPPLIGPAGTVHASLRDWAKFISAHLRGEQGEDGLLKAATFRKLHQPAFGGEYACGWVTGQREWAGGPVFSHNGSNQLNFAVAWVAPKKDYAFLACANQGMQDAEQACDEAISAMVTQRLINGK